MKTRRNEARIARIRKFEARVAKLGFILVLGMAAFGGGYLASQRDAVAGKVASYLSAADQAIIGEARKMASGQMSSL